MNKLYFYKVLLLSLLVASGQLVSSEQPGCGQFRSPKRALTSRIFEGHDAQPGQFPHQVWVQAGFEKGIRPEELCGGIVIDSQHILTAAHCVTHCSKSKTVAAVKFDVTAGTHVRNETNTGQVNFRASIKRIHKNFDACHPQLTGFDIAILKTDAPMEFKITEDGIGSINKPCLPFSGISGGERVLVSGWGHTEASAEPVKTLKWVDLQITNCRNPQKGLLCAGGLPGHNCASTNRGDSGGALVRVKDGFYELLGINVGFLPEGCGDSFYVKVQDHYAWITKNL